MSFKKARDRDCGDEINPDGDYRRKHPPGGGVGEDVPEREAAPEGD